MGLDIQRLAALGANIGMELAGNAKIAVVLHVANGAPTYDPATDTMTKPVTDIPVDALSYMARNEQTTNKEVTFSPNVRKLLIEAADLPDGTVITEEDTVTFDSANWGIMVADRPPGNAIWILDVRK